MGVPAAAETVMQDGTSAQQDAAGLADLVEQATQARKRSTQTAGMAAAVHQQAASARERAALAKQRELAVHARAIQLHEQAASLQDRWATRIGRPRPARTPPTPGSCSSGLVPSSKRSSNSSAECGRMGRRAGG